MSFNTIIRIFERRGIADPAQITEYVAFLLLAYKKEPNLGNDSGALDWRKRHTWDDIRTRMLNAKSEDDEGDNVDYVPPIPDYPPLAVIDAEVLEELVKAILQLVKDAPDLGTLFQQQVRYHLLRNTKGEYYPTPHHLATFLAQLIIDPYRSYEHSLYDPTAGSGGLLIAAREICPNLKIVGTDYNQRWSRLGMANLLLHDIEGAHVSHSDAESYKKTHTIEGRFDYVLMNPPFASGVITDLIKLAFDSLNGTGQGVVLVPSGVVQRENTLFDDDQLEAVDVQLEAVVTLPPDAFQPYNGIRSHALVVKKRRVYEDTEDTIWLCELLSDGYGTGMGRPLDRATPLDPSELPRTQQLIYNQWQDGEWQDGEWKRVFGNSSSMPSIGINDLTQEWSGDQIEEESGEEKAFSEEELFFIDALLLQPQDGRHPAGVALRAQKAIRWFAFHWATGELIWTEESTLFAAQKRLWVHYDGDWTTVHKLESTKVVKWKELLPTTSATPLNTDQPWIISGSDITVSVTNNKLTIDFSSRTKHEFEQGTVIKAGACLLDENGRIISPWFTTDELPEKLREKLTDNGLPLYGLTDEKIGWLVPLPAQEQSGSLLVVRTPTAQVAWHDDFVGVAGLLFQAEGDGQPEQGGMWRIKNGQFSSFSGRRVPTELRTKDGKALGIALGPRVENPDEGRLFGVCLNRAQLQGQPLEPEQYLPEVRETAVLLSPAELLAKIRTNQGELSGKIDWLLQTLTIRGETAEEGGEIETAIHNQFSPVQQSLWKFIQNAEGYFSAEEFAKQGQTQLNLSEPEILQQIDLFISLGLLLPVYQAGQNRYRRVKTADLVGSPV